MTAQDWQDTSVLAPFVPRLAAELSRESDGDSPPGNLGVQLEGSMLSADISGFTALSERLAGKGKAGAEEITDLINECFTAMIDAAYDFGGEVIKFGGDALLILFRGEQHEVRCAGAGLAMQHALLSSGAAKRASLSMTVGCSNGPFDVFVVGSSYRELLVVGDAASEVIRLEAAAGSGETLVSPAIAAHLDEGQVGGEHDGGLVALAVDESARIGTTVRDDPGGDIARFVPDAVLEQLSAFAELGGEHRLVTVGFVMVQGLEAAMRAGGPEFADVIGFGIDSIVSACDAAGVTVLHTDIAPDGIKFVLCAGAPLTSGNTSDALLTAALQIAAIPTPFAVRVGVQRGRVFAGFLGSPYRRTYTLMGDPVNTAARMLGKAEPGQVIAVEDVIHDTRTVFRTTELEPFHVKGKVEPIVAHRVEEATDERRRGVATTAFVGRADELEVLSDALLIGGRVVHLSGPAGVGKSHVLDAAIRSAAPGRIVRGTCSQYNQFTPYSVFRPAFLKALGLSGSDGPIEAGERLTAMVAASVPELAPLLPLLAIPFGAEVAATPEVDAIDTEFRRFRMHETLVEFIDHAMPGAVALLIEDVHWIDTASGDLLAYLCEASAKRDWTVLITSRPQSSWVLDADLEHVQRLDLQPLDDDDIRRLVIDASSRPLRDHEVDLVVERSHGNPLFVIELATAVSEGRTELPGSVEELIGDRIDDLEPEQRLVLRIAAVIGPQFTMSDLVPVATSIAPGIDPNVIVDLDGLIEGGADDTWSFAHGLYHETAYEGLPFKRRRELHQVVGEHLEQADTARTEADPMVLSMHFHRANDYERSWRYSREAGQASSQQGASQEAAEAFARAEEAGRHLPAVDDAGRFIVNEQLGDAWYLTGDFPRASAGFRRAKRHAPALADELRVMRKEGDLRERTGNSSQAMRWYNRALRLLPEEVDDPNLAHERASIYLAQAGVRHRQTNHRACARLATRALIDGTRTSDLPIIAMAHERLQLAYTYLRDSRSKHHGDRARDMYDSIGDVRSVSRVLGTMGIAAHFLGDWVTAAQRYREASSAASRSGDKIEAQIGQNNLAEVLADQGHWVEAIEIFSDILRAWTASAFAIGIGVARGNLAYALARSGRPDQAVPLLVDARGHFEQLGASDFALEMRLRLAESHLLAKDYASARSDALELRAELPANPDETDDTKALSRVLRILGALSFLDGDEAAAERLFIDSLVMAITSGDDFLASLTHIELSNAGIDSDLHDQQANAILGSLGVVGVAEFLRNTNA